MIGWVFLLLTFLSPNTEFPLARWTRTSQVHTREMSFKRVDVCEVHLTASQTEDANVEGMKANG